jgi:hypothetical protein
VTRLVLAAAILALLVPASALASLDRTDRREINSVVDRFVRQAVERRDPGAAYALASPAMRNGTTRADWRRGDIPVMPYRTVGRTFHHWTLVYAEGKQVGLDLILKPSRTNRQGPIVFAVDLRRVNDDWRVESFLPAATFARDDEPPRMFSALDLNPQPSGGSTGRAKPRVGAGFAALPLVFLGAAVLPLLALGIVSVIRHRRAQRRFQLGS